MPHSNLKDKTFKGLIWSFIDSFMGQGIPFLVGLILARLLTPHDFGLIGMITIFIAISQSFVDSGFGNALIRKTDCKPIDYSTVFFFNLGVSVFFAFILFFSSSLISKFFNEPELELLVKVLGIGIVINAGGLIQRTILTKNIDFKTQTKVSVISSIVAGVLAITMALKGFGVWSLVALTISRQTLNTLFFWIAAKWRPTLAFSLGSFYELFGFGSKLLISGLIDTIYRNVYLLIIGKYFSAIELGFYTRADQFRNLPSQNITGVIQRVSYPILSEIQSDLPTLKSAFKKLIKSTMFITFILMMILAAIAKPLILTLIGDQWLPSVIYLQLLSVAGMFYPLHALNLNLLNVKGRSDLFLRLEIIKKILAIPVIVVGVFLGIKMMIVGMIILTIIAYFLNSYFSGREIGYSSIQQLKDIFPSFIFALFISSIVYSIGLLLQLPNYLILIIQLVVGGGLALGLAELIKMKDYIFIKNFLLNKISNRQDAKKL